MARKKPSYNTKAARKQAKSNASQVIFKNPKSKTRVFFLRGNPRFNPEDGALLRIPKNSTRVQKNADGKVTKAKRIPKGAKRHVFYNTKRIVRGASAAEKRDADLWAAKEQSDLAQNVLDLAHNKKTKKRMETLARGRAVFAAHKKRQAKQAKRPTAEERIAKYAMPKATTMSRYRRKG